MSICKFQSSKYMCDWESDENTGDGFCILHSPNADKDHEAFQKALTALREKHVDSFIGFVFPASFAFKNALFSRNAVFLSSKFNGKVEFHNATFTGKAVFNGATFSADATFRSAKFNEDASFDGTQFTHNVSFKDAKFLSRTLFAPGKEDGEVIQIFPGADSAAECDFRNAIIDPPDSLIFRDVDLTKCRFQGTDLRKVEFTGVEWPQIVSKKWPKIIRKTWPTIGRRFGVYDEIAPLPEGQTRAWHHIERLYRELKQNYEDRRDYERASDFHYGEKEMRRRNPQTSWGLRVLLSIYWLLSGYGERYVRPLICATVVLLVGAVLYMCLGLSPKSGGPTLDVMSAWDWLRSAFYSFRVMTLLRPDDLAPIRYAKLVHAFQSLSGPVLLGLFALAVRQRLKR